MPKPKTKIEEIRMAFQEKFVRDTLKVMEGEIHATCACGIPHSFLIGSPQEHEDFLTKSLIEVAESMIIEKPEPCDGACCGLDDVCCGSHNKRENVYEWQLKKLKELKGEEK